MLILTFLMLYLLRSGRLLLRPRRAGVTGGRIFPVFTRFPFTLRMFVQHSLSSHLSPPWL